MAKPPFQVKALYDYKSPHEDDLSFQSAQLITVTDEEDNDWYYGEFEDANGTKQEGLFPRNFVKPYEPETPPRPNRQNRAKKETGSAPKAADAEEPRGSLDIQQDVSQASISQPIQAAESQEPDESLEAEPETEPEPKPEPLPPPAAIPPAAQASSRDPPSTAPLASKEVKPTPPFASKGPPPSVTEKPASGSFRDRINAFNKSSAPPPAPSKPAALGGSGGSSFVKKPFVAPPPSKNAYVPPPRQDAPHKVYRREEEPEGVAQASRNRDEEESLLTPAQTTQANDSEDQPKPTSLKERIALLQKQQAEQASRHAERKEKPKRPPKRQEADFPAPERDEEEEGEELERAKSNETAGKRSTDTARDPRTSTRPRKPREEAPMGSAVAVPAREVFSDGNEADQSGAADTGEEEDQSTGRDDSDDKFNRQAPVLQHRTPQATNQGRKSENIDEEEEDEDEEDEEDEEEDQDVDPEVKRRMEIRERMAKMSGGMGMAGMFGAPGGMPQPKPPTKQGSGSSERNLAGTSKHEPPSEAFRAPLVPLMPMPGLTKVKSPVVEAAAPLEPEVEKEASEEPRSVVQGRGPEEMPDVEDLVEEPTPTRRSTDHAPLPAPPLQTREIPSLPGQSKGAPPLPTERPVPPPPANSRPVPPTPSQPLSPSEGSMSDDEMPTHPNESGLDDSMASNEARPTTRGAFPAEDPPPAMPSRPKAPQSRPSELGAEGLGISSPVSPTSPSEKRSSRLPPPIPGAMPAVSSAPQTRAPPPPPPAAAPAAPSRTATSSSRGAPVIANSRGAEVSDEEVTEYDGDYDTDMASGATHKDALKSHGRVSSLDDESMTEGEAAMHHIGLPSMGPQMSTPRAAAPPPPPPSTQPSRSIRQSSDMPRAAPPPPPPPKEQFYDDQNDEYDPYNYTSALGPRATSGKGQSVATPTVEEPENMFASSTPQQFDPFPSSPSMAIPGRSAQRQSLDIQRTSTSVRRSMDVARSPGEHGIMATDADLGAGSRWWTQPNAPPPIFQNRRDILFETEEASVAKRGGKQAITRTVYVLFMDYSQTVITAQYEVHNPATAHLEQTHEPPPRNLRQDQLEDAHSRFGAQIAKDAEAKKETVMGDGSPHALPFELISSMPDALLPVGIRAYGALVYANLANASVQQFDEIRPGDIVTFRNAKFQGHRGTMHSKYAMDVGKPDHVAVVHDWDGTKKKVRAWEQGRESKKVKPESFKFGDMKSGEVKVWRVMARSWVGWEGQN